MYYEELKELSPPNFRRSCGVNWQTFHAMVEVLRSKLDRKGKRGGQNRLSVEDQLLMTLQYWREYRTQFHIALDFGVSEATVCRTIRKVENELIRCGLFRLPSKRQLLDTETDRTVALVDVTEITIERPKKNSAITTAVNREDIL
jgi:hypothetical protein